MSRRQECSDCNCNKSLHHRYKGRTFCDGCYQIYRDNRAEYFKLGLNAWHEFKLDNLKFLEQCYESRNQ